MATKMKGVDFDQVRADWLQVTDQFRAQMESWLASHPAHPNIKRATTEIVEQHTGSYSLIGLEAEFPNGDITIEPSPRNYPGNGQFTIRSWPTLRRVRLIVTGEHPEIMTDSNIPLRQPWNEQTFHQLVDDLLSQE